MNNVAEVARTFQYDYIYFDAILLVAWIFILCKKKEYKALLFGVVIAPLIYAVDAGIWWHTKLSTGTYIREYWYGGMQLPHPLGNYAWLKFGADFMMTISYALFTFPWLWIAFRNIRLGEYKEVIRYTLFWFCAWLLVPLLSLLIPLQDTTINTVRHMHSQLPFWIGATTLGYIVLCTVYKRNLKRVLLVFLIGLVGAFIMELPLLVFGIRPIGAGVLIFDSVFMLNQAVPWLYLLYDKLLTPKYNASS